MNENLFTIDRGFVCRCSFKKCGVNSCPILHFDSIIVDTKTVPTSVSKSTPVGNTPLDKAKEPTADSKSTPVGIRVSEFVRTIVGSPAADTKSTPVGL